MSSNEQPVRIGIVGLGTNTRERHVPGFRKLPNVQIVGVANRTRESGERAAREFDIPNVYDNWMEVVAAEDVDAVMIGTWPYLHCPVTLAALNAGKHVLTEARMALNADEAHMMLQASREHPEAVAQVVPSPYTFKVDRTIQDLLAEGYVGDVVELDLRAGDGRFANYDAPLHWRQDRDLSGYNILNLGIWYEALMRWVGPAATVSAMSRVVVNRRRDASGVVRTVSVPDLVEITARLEIGALARMRFSAVTGFDEPGYVAIYGTQGTLRLDTATLKLYGGRRGGKELREIVPAPEKEGRWRVEEEFCNAVRGKEQVRLTDFATGVKYMEFTEAVTRSAQSGEVIPLPM